MLLLIQIIIVIKMIVTRPSASSCRSPRGSRGRLGKGQMGSSIMGSLHVLCFLTGTCWVITQVNLLSFSQKCQGVPFSTICQSALLLQRPHKGAWSANKHETTRKPKQKQHLCSGPISVDPICPQPRPGRCWPSSCP